MGIAPRIVRRGVATAPAAPAVKPAPATPAQDLAAELTAEEDTSTVVEIPAEEPAEEEETAPVVEAATPAPAPAAPARTFPARKVATAAPATNVAAALDKAAKEQKTRFSPLPKKVIINKGAKENKEPEEGDRITRDYLFEKFWEELQKYEEMDFTGVTKAQARRLFEFFESFTSGVIDKFEILFMGMLFKHQEKTGSFREPKDVIFYNGPHLEIVGRKVFPGVTAALQVINGKVKIGHVKEGVAEEEPDKIVEDPELAKVVRPEYDKHLEKTVNRLEADDAKAAARAAKLQERAAAILK